VTLERRVASGIIAPKVPVASDHEGQLDTSPIVWGVFPNSVVLYIPEMIVNEITEPSTTEILGANGDFVLRHVGDNIHGVEFERPGDFIAGLIRPMIAYQRFFH